MRTREEVQIQHFQQTVISADPGVPNGILVPRGANFAPDHMRNLIDNPQVQKDGAEREPALGNHTSKVSGTSVPNLSYFGHIMKALCVTLGTTGAGPYTHVGALTPGAVQYMLFEMGIGSGLFYKFYDMVMTRLRMQFPVEGIFTVEEEYEGSGKIATGGASLDATPTEVTGAPAEYADFSLLVDAADLGITTDLSIELTRRAVQKRPHSSAGLAKEIKYGGFKVGGVIDMFFESDAQWLKARTGVLSALKATIVSGTASLEALMPEVKFEPAGPKIESEDGITQSFNYRAIKKANADSPIKLTLINGVASY